MIVSPLPKFGIFLITHSSSHFLFRFGDGDDDDDGAASVTAKPSKNPVLEKLGAEDGNISVAGVTNVVKDRVGNLLGKGIGGIGGISGMATKFGGGSWF